MRAWLDSIAQTTDELRHRGGLEEVDLVGIRMGATLAAVTGAERGGIRSLVLWSACIAGTAYLRELHALRMLSAAGASAPGDGRHLHDCDEEAAGIVLSRSTLGKLATIDLRELAAAPARRVLVLMRDDLPGQEARLTRALTQAGAEVSVKRVPGYAAMMR